MKILLAPMAKTGAEPLGAMGSDTPIAVLSKRPRLLFDYFTQQFAQVTNPPLDSIREEVVTSLGTSLGPERNLLAAGPEHARQVVARLPGDRQRRAREDPAHRPDAGRAHDRDRSAASTASTRAPRRSRDRLAAMCGEVDEAIEDGRGLHRAERPRLHQGPRADPVAADARPRCTTT